LKNKAKKDIKILRLIDQTCYQVYKIWITNWNKTQENHEFYFLKKNENQIWQIKNLKEDEIKKNLIL